MAKKERYDIPVYHYVASMKDRPAGGYIARIGTSQHRMKTGISAVRSTTMRPNGWEIERLLWLWQETMRAVPEEDFW